MTALTMCPAPTHPDRVQLAEEFLREAVFRSRATQAFRTAIQKSAAPAGGNCGLGERAAVVLDLSERGRELFEALWSSDPGEAGLARLHASMRAWIEEQDALDRKRNHFLKAFRGAHGFDRTRYSADEIAHYEQGLAKINREEDERRRSTASALAQSVPLAP